MLLDITFYILRVDVRLFDLELFAQTFVTKAFLSHQLAVAHIQPQSFKAVCLKTFFCIWVPTQLSFSCFLRLHQIPVFSPIVILNQ